MLKADNLGCWRDGQELFSKLTFKIAPGSIVWVSGENGTGKSSLLKILAGILPVSEGRLTWQERPIRCQDPFFLQNLLYIGHKIAIQPDLTPLENLEWLVKMTSVKPSDSRDWMAALQTVGLETEAAQMTPCKALSRGQRQRVALARLWVEPAQCWILDEPCAALDKAGIILLQKRFVAHVAQGGIVILASHYPFNFNPFKPIEIVLRHGSLC